jgi:DNA-binding response OmpR family regulator
MSNKNPSQSTILVVDDNPTNLSVLVDLLKEDGFKVLVATDGLMALKQLERSMPDMILLDVMMPGIDGFETCRRLKGNSITHDIPVIFLSALSDTVNKLEGFEVGAIDYITKPINSEEVLARVKTHLSIHTLRKSLQNQNASLQRKIKEHKKLEKKFIESLEMLETLKKNIEEIWRESQAINGNFMSSTSVFSLKANPSPSVTPDLSKSEIGDTPWEQLVEGIIDVETAINMLVDKQGKVNIDALDPDTYARFKLEFGAANYLPAFIPLLLWHGCYYLGSPIELPRAEIQKLSDLMRYHLRVIPISQESYQDWLNKGMGAGKIAG